MQDTGSLVTFPEGRIDLLKNTTNYCMLEWHKTHHEMHVFYDADALLCVTWWWWNISIFQRYNYAIITAWWRHVMSCITIPLRGESTNGGFGQAVETQSILRWFETPWRSYDVTITAFWFQIRDSLSAPNAQFQSGCSSPYQSNVPTPITRTKRVVGSNKGVCSL